MTYNERISRFTIYDNPPYKKGFDRHHIVPESEQKKLYGSVIDERQIYVCLSMHMWLHILYDRENGTKTAKRFLDICGKPIEYFDCWEKCLAYSYTLRKKREEGDRKAAEACRTPEHRQKLSDSLKGIHRSEETRQKISDSLKGKNTWMKGKRLPEETRQKLSDSMKGNTNTKGRKWFNNGIKNVMTYECPDGFVPGRLKREENSCYMPS